MAPLRPLSARRWALLLAAHFTLLLNLPFYGRLAEYRQQWDFFVLSAPAVVFLALNGFFLLIQLPYLQRLLVPLIIFISAIVSYGSLVFGIYFDKNLLTNVLETTAAESSSSVNGLYIVWGLLLGLLPALAYALWPRRSYPLREEVSRRGRSLAASLLLLLALVYPQRAAYLSLIREYRESAAMLVPWNFLAALGQRLRRPGEAPPHQIIDPDIRALPRSGPPRLMVVVIGETTRAASWGLNGYRRQTTPRLARRSDLINYRQVRSCGTTTAVSVPCLFAPENRQQFDEVQAAHRDNLLDLLKRAGVETLWLDNDMSCKGVCNRMASLDLIALDLPGLCADGVCFDEIFLHRWADIIGTNGGRDRLVVLHSIGSHHPYNERYPPAFSRFRPVCRERNVRFCGTDSLRNSYDNSVLYVDFVLDQIIGRLERLANRQVGLIYVSDHGESLGEKGLYLHGTPYAVAPPEQTEVPMFFWFNAAWRQRLPMDCLRRNATVRSYSHDNFYATVFSLMGLDPASSSSYQHLLDKDLLAECAGG